MLSMLCGERSLTHVTALFDRAIEARTAAEHVVRVGRLPLKRVLVGGPADPAPAHARGPEARGVFPTPVKCLVRLATKGLVLGLLGGWALSLIGFGFAAASPYCTVGATGVFGLIAGVALDEMAALRNDHALLVDRIRDGLGKAQWAVVVRPTNRDPVDRAVNVLEYCGGDLILTS